MKDKERTKEQPMSELKEMRERIIELETLTARYKQELKELKSVEQRYQSIFELAPDGILMIDAKGVIKSCNEAYFNLTGFSKEEIIGKHFTKLPLLRVRDIPKYVKLFASMLSGKEIEPIEFTWIHKDGTSRTGEFRAAMIKAGRRIIGVQAVARDITERTRVEEALRKSEERYRDLFDNASELIQSIDRQGKFVYANKAWLDSLGYDESEIKGLSFTDIIHPDHLAHCNEVFQRLMSGEKVPRIETTFISKDGNSIQVEGDVTAQYENNEVVGTRGIIHDVTERKEAQKAIRESEEKFSKAFNASPDMVIISDLKDGTYVEVNDSFVSGTGYQRDELTGHTVDEFALWVNPEDGEKMIRMIEKQGNIRNEVFNFRMKSGEIRTWLCSVEIINIGADTYMIGVSTDITERQKREHLQQDENTVLTLLGQGAELGELLDAIVHLGEDHDPAIIGSVLTFDPVKQWLNQASGPSLPAEYLKLMENGLPVGPNMGSCGTAAYRKERVIIPDIANDPLFASAEEVVNTTVKNNMLACWSQPILSSNGELLGTIANYSKKIGNPDPDDIRILEWSARIAAIAIEHKQAEEALRMSEERFRLIADNASDLVSRIQMTPDIRTDYVSPSCLRITGYKQEEFYKDPNLGLEMIHPDDREFFIKHVASDNKKDQKPITAKLVRKDGQVIWIEQTHTAILNDQGETVAMHLIARDITERKHSEEQLKHAMVNLEHSSAQLAATNKELETFSYSVSHDLGSPLRSIDGFSQALLEDYPESLDDTGKDYLNRLRTASQKMGELIDGLLKLSRLTRSEMHQKKVNLSMLVKEITSRLHENEPKRQVEFVIRKGLATQGDPELLRALFENLLGNAWKFTGKNKKTRIEFGTTKNGNKTTYYINDNGAGFDMTYADKLFGAFQRLHDTSEYPGTGIGLATVLRIINRHGGNIWAEGAVNKGATFYFTLN